MLHICNVCIQLYILLLVVLLWAMINSMFVQLLLCVIKYYICYLFLACLALLSLYISIMSNNHVLLLTSLSCSE